MPGSEEEAEGSETERAAPTKATMANKANQSKRSFKSSTTPLSIFLSEVCVLFVLNSATYQLAESRTPLAVHPAGKAHEALDRSRQTLAD
jgi:hypothetical protein